MKKKLALILIILVVLVGGGIFAYSKLGKGSEQSSSPTPKPRLTIPANQIPVSERPYVELQPTAGREVVLRVGDLRKQAESLDFELQYSSGDKEEAAIGSIELTGQAPHSKTILLGSKSGGGKVTYHEDVTGGTLVLSFYDENYKLSNEWSYVDNTPSQTNFSSRDAKFQIETGSLLRGSPYVIVYSNPGLPENLDRELQSGPYSIQGTSNLPTGSVTVTMRLNEEKPVEILGWTGSDWKVFPAKIEGKSATAEVDLLDTYIAVTKN